MRANLSRSRGLLGLFVLLGGTTLLCATSTGCETGAGRPDASTHASTDAGIDPVFADAIWQVRCPIGLASCATDGARHNVFGFDGQEDGNRSRGCKTLIISGASEFRIDGGSRS